MTRRLLALSVALLAMLTLTLSAHTDSTAGDLSCPDGTDVSDLIVCNVDPLLGVTTTPMWTWAMVNTTIW